jgi:hypothetical protein
MTIRAFKTFRSGPEPFTVSRSGLSTSVGGNRFGSAPGLAGGAPCATA